jgi:RNA polymerase sigma-70 factor (ECF subfamily)
LVATDVGSVEDVYRRRHTAFRSAIATIVGSYEAADDVVQESFARALAKLDTYRGEGSLEAWIWKIAVRTALERNRARRDVALNDVEVGPKFVHVERDPELADAVRRLPPRRRLIVFLRYIADLSYSDIASACSISEGTVAATLAQAREMLAAELGDELGIGRSGRSAP